MPRYAAPLPRSVRRQKFLARGLRVAAVSLALGASCGPAQADATQDLYRAVHADDLDAVKASLAAGANPITRDRDGLTPAMLADELGHRAIARYLQDTAPANEESTRSEAASERGFLDRLLARATTRRQIEPVKVSIPIAAAPDKARIQQISPDKAPMPVPSPAEARDSTPPASPGTSHTTAAAAVENAAPNEVKTEAQALPRPPSPRRERHAAKSVPRFAFPPPPRKPAFVASEAVAADAPNNPFDPASAPIGSALAVIGNAPLSEPTSTPSLSEANPPSTETRKPIAVAAHTEAAPGEPAPASVSSPVVPATAATPRSFDHKTPNAFDRFLSSLFNPDGQQETTAAPAAPETARVDPPSEKAQTAASTDQSKPQAAPNAIDRFLRRLFSLGGDDDAAAISAPAAQAEAPSPLPAAQVAAVAPTPVKDGPNAIDLFLRRFFADAAEPRADTESPSDAPAEIASATPASKPIAPPASEPTPASTVAAGDVDPLSRALRSLFQGIADKNVHAQAPRAEDTPPPPPIEVADASNAVASDRPLAEPPPPAAIMTAVPTAPLTFAAAEPAARRAPSPNARAISGAPPEAAASLVVAENVLKPMIANPPAPTVEPAGPTVELAARPEPAAAVPPRPAPFKPVRRPPLSGVPLALGQTATIGRPWPAPNLPPHSCIIKKAWNAGFCVEPLDWPAAALPIFDVNSPLYRGTMAVTRYEGGTARQYHSVFPAAMFGDVVRFFEGNLGPATEEDMKTVAMPGQPALRNPIRRWISVDPQTGRKTVIEVRGFDDLRNFIPDAEYGVTRLYEEGSGPVFEFLGTAELLLMRIRQTSAAFPTLEPLKNDPATR